MIKNKNFIVFSDDWGRHPSSCQHIFKRIAKTNKVLWVNTLGLRRPSIDKYTFLRGIEKVRDWFVGMRKVNDNLWVYSPFMLPFMGLTYEKLFNVEHVVFALRKKLEELDMQSPILWTTVPNIVDLVGRLGEILKIYY